jgi:hypothetical protein
LQGRSHLAIGGFIIPPLVVRESGGYKIVVGYFPYQVAVLARQLNSLGRRNNSSASQTARKSSRTFDPG